MDFTKIVFGIVSLFVVAILVWQIIIPLVSIFIVVIKTGRFPKSMAVKHLDGTITGKCPECGEKIEFIESKNFYLYECDKCGSKSKDRGDSSGD